MTKVLGGVGRMAGHWKPGTQAPLLVFLLPPQKTLNTNAVMCNKNLQKESFGYSHPSSVQAREAPVNDKATAKHHWSGPGTNIGRGSSAQRAPYQHIIPHKHSPGSLSEAEKWFEHQLLSTLQRLCLGTPFLVKKSKGASRELGEPERSKPY